MTKDYQRKMVKKLTINKIVLEIDGYYNESTPYGKYEWYDVFHRGECVNEGEPFERPPTKAQIEKIVKNIKKEYAMGLWKR